MSLDVQVTTATLLSSHPLNFEVRGGGFASRQFGR